MSIQYSDNDLFACGAQALVNPVNCVGTMGKGLALAFKQNFPRNYQAYVQACRAGQIQPGRIMVFDRGTPSSPRYIINLPTKRHWRESSRLEDVEEGLRDMLRVLDRYAIESVGIPALGCGWGGLDWQIVRERMQDILAHQPSVSFTLFPPKSATNIPRAAPRVAVPAPAPRFSPGRP